MNTLFTAAEKVLIRFLETYEQKSPAMAQALSREYFNEEKVRDLAHDAGINTTLPAKPQTLAA